MASEQEEMEVLKQNFAEAEEEAKQADSDGKHEGWIGITIGLIGLFLPIPLGILAAAMAATLGVYANRKGQKNLAMACGVLAILGMIPLFIQIRF